MEINDIIAAISIKLHNTFGEGYTNYIDEVPQGFTPPAFLILFLSLENIRQIGKRWRVTTLFNIQYFSDKAENKRTDASNHALKIQQALSEITLLNGAIMLGTGANSEIVDGNAHNFIHFNFFLQEIEAKVFMESLEQHSTPKG
ncbi:phage tail terminator family protein [Lysinibacillus telephonicus]|uniref:phage tail terminator family protein n=1 Tax=Lysinibacillus telephonicus TaxID=1714840 RepID=UPI0037D19941